MPNNRVGRLLRAGDFEKVLERPASVRSAHFALHGLGASPGRSKRAGYQLVGNDLSTGPAPNLPGSVDNWDSDALQGDPSGASLWLGIVMPKRLARASVTRSLLKRQVREGVSRHAAGLQAGLWVVRLRAAFDPSTYPSAASDALRIAVRAELEELLGSLVKFRPAS